MDSINLSLAELDVAARTVDGEAANQGADGMAAVAWVFRNRAQWKPAAWWGAHIVAVCVHPDQFSCWLPGPDRDRINALSRSGNEYLKACDIVQAVMDGTIPDPTGGATTYKVRGTLASWNDAVKDFPPRQIGAHDFWRLGPDGVCHDLNGIGGTDGGTSNA